MDFNQFNEFHVEYYKNKLNLRYGQAFCNKFSIQDSSLFYEPSTEEALNTIIDKYVSKIIPSESIISVAHQ